MNGFQHNFEMHCVQEALTVLGRLFPFDRGIYEDKVTWQPGTTIYALCQVGNFWGTTSLLIKWKQLFAQPVLVKMRCEHMQSSAVC